MKSTVTVQMETSTLLKLINRLSELGGTHDLSEGVSSAIEFWLAEQAKLATGCDPASVRGYQWKSLFLPDGTVLRSWSWRSQLRPGRRPRMDLARAAQCVSGWKT